MTCFLLGLTGVTSAGGDQQARTIPGLPLYAVVDA
jgi:hypothetical protein